jgi:ribosomal protein L35
MNKTHKSVSKRLKVTKNGKIMMRAGGQGHFNSRESGKTTLNKRRDTKMSDAMRRNLKALLPNHRV